MRLFWKAAVLATLTAAVFTGCGSSGEVEVPMVNEPNPELEQQVMEQIQQRQNQNVVEQPTAPAESTQ